MTDGGFEILPKSRAYLPARRSSRVRPALEELKRAGVGNVAKISIGTHSAKYLQNQAHTTAHRLGITILTATDENFLWVEITGTYDAPEPFRMERKQVAVSTQILRSLGR